MKHIHTTATAIRKIKLAAKSIKSEQNITLAKALDQAAIHAGYDNFHHASHCASNTETKSTFKGLGTLTFVLDEENRDWGVADDDGDIIDTSNIRSGQFRVGENKESLNEVTDILDDLSDAVGAGYGDMTEIPESGLQEIIKACTKLTKQEPAFIDGYAHWAGALVSLKQHKECIAMAAPVFDAACALIPSDIEVFIPYSYLSNRPFHRLANNLLLAYYGVGKNDEAKAIAQQMLKWWPKDNIGFRFMLEPED